VVVQLLWESAWFINASNTNFKILENITISAYKVTMNLPRSASNKMCWAVSAQSSIKRRISNMCDKFIFRTIQLSKVNISNKIQNICGIVKSRIVSKRNIPFLVRWNKSELAFANLYK